MGFCVKSAKRGPFNSLLFSSQSTVRKFNYYNSFFVKHWKWSIQNSFHLFSHLILQIFALNVFHWTVKKRIKLNYQWRIFGTSMSDSCIFHCVLNALKGQAFKIKWCATHHKRNKKLLRIFAEIKSSLRHISFY